MALPSGITTTQLTFGTAVDLITGEPFAMTVTCTPVTSLVWAATGTVLIGTGHGYTASPDTQGSITLVNPDQAGFTDGNGNTVRNWPYKVDAVYKNSAGTIVFTAPPKYVTWHASDTGPIDLDLLVPVASTSGVTVWLPDSWSASIAQLDGRVSSLEAGGAGGGGGGGGGGTVAPATSTTSGVIRLAGDLAGTSTAPTVPGLAAKAPLASPAFTGTPTISGTPVARTTDITTAVNNLVGAAPGTLDTLGEIAAQLQNDESAATALTTAVAAKAPLASPAFTGTPTVPTAATGTATTQAASTAFVAAAIAAVPAQTSTSSSYSSFGILSAGIAKRTSTATNLVFAGSSTTEGFQATAVAKRYVNVLAARLQAAYPSGTGSEAAVISDASAAWSTVSTTPGLHIYNVGQGGTDSTSYLTDGEAANVAALNPIMVMHMIGSNDFANGMNPATFQANVANRVAKIKSLVTKPCVQILVQSYERYDNSTHSYPWAQYGAAMKTIADADPTNVAYIDLSPGYYAIGIPSTDPLGFMYSDHIHQVDDGHAFMAEQLYRAIAGTAPTSAPAATGGTTTPALTNTTAPTVSGTGTVGQTLTTTNGSWSATPDSYTYQWKRAGANISGATSATYVLVSADAGTTITCTVTAIKSGYTSGTASSNGVTVAGGATAQVTDSFTRADSDLIGSSTETGSKTWAAVKASGGAAYTAGDILVQSSVVGSRNANITTTFAYVPVASADMTVQCKLSAINTTAPTMGGGLAGRISATDGTGFFLSTRIDGATIGYAIYQFTASSVAKLTQSSTGQTPTAGDILKLVFSGTTITGYVNGTQIMQATGVTANQTTATAGFVIHNAGKDSRYDDFAVTT